MLKRETHRCRSSVPVPLTAMARSPTTGRPDQPSSASSAGANDPRACSIRDPALDGRGARPLSFANHKGQVIPWLVAGANGLA